VRRSSTVWDGEMARIRTSPACSFKTLNTSKGRPVHSRARVRQELYQFSMKETIEAQPNLDARQDEASALWIEGGVLRGVLSRAACATKGGCVIITTGPSSNGLAHVGLQSFPSGRAGTRRPSASGSLRELGFEVRPQKRTPPRLNARSIDFTACELDPRGPAAALLAFH